MKAKVCAAILAGALWAAILWVGGFDFNKREFMTAYFLVIGICISGFAFAATPKDKDLK